MIRFSKYIWVYILISSLVLVPGVFSLVRFGLRPAIDFTGGTLLEITFPSPISAQSVIDLSQKDGIPLVSIQQQNEKNFLLRTKPVSDEKSASFLAHVQKLSTTAPVINRNETVGPILGQELLSKALFAAVLAICAILLYVAWAFKNIKFGVSAIIALIHDLLVVLGTFSLLGVFTHVEVDTLFVTAFLTTMSFSVHDTIVVFDRIRELMKRTDSEALEEVADRALTQTLGRSLANSFTIIFMLLALVLMGGTSIRWFVVALLVGTTSGAYSSPFVATPILIFWDRWEKRRRR